MPDIPTSGILPKHPPPIILVGAGGIVNDAHLPAYKIAKFPVAAIYDIDVSKAQATARKFDIPQVFETLDELLAAATDQVVFDIALPAYATLAILQKLPNGATVLLQKPMGENLEQAKAILELTRQKEMIAGMNFQLRYAPFICAARHFIENGLIGDLCDVEISVNVYTPWHLWSFLYELPRVEILYHSIHYIDLIRSLLGEPKSVYAKTVKHPLMNALASVKTNLIMDYGDMIGVHINTNHCHQFGLEKQHAHIKVEGTRGAVVMRMGVLMNYPQGIDDRFEYIIKDEGTETWQTLNIEGSWFPHAFIGTMAQVMLAKEGSLSKPGNSVEDAIFTMACVEAAYQSSGAGGVNPAALL